MKIITEEKISSVINKAIALGLDVCSKLGNKTKKDTALPTATALKDAEGNPIIDGEGNQVYDYNGDLYYLGCEKNKSITIVNVHPFRISNIVNNLSSYDDPSTDIVTDPVDDTNYQDIESCDITWTGGTPPFKIQLVTDIYNNLVSEVITPIITTPLDTTTVININPKLLTSTGDSSLNARTYNLSKLDPTDTWYGNDLDIDAGNTNHQKYIGLLITDSFIITPATETEPAIYRTLFIPFTPDQVDVLNKVYNLPNTYTHYGPYSFGIPRIRELTPLSTTLILYYGQRITNTNKQTYYNLKTYVPGTYNIENTELVGTYTYNFYNPNIDNQVSIMNVLFNATDSVGNSPTLITTSTTFDATDTTKYKTSRAKVATLTINKDTPIITPSNTTVIGDYLDITWSYISDTYSFLNSRDSSIPVDGNNGASLSFSGIGDAGTLIPAGGHTVYANLEGGLNYNSETIPITIRIDKLAPAAAATLAKLVWTFYVIRQNNYTGSLSYTTQMDIYSYSTGKPRLLISSPVYGGHDYTSFVSPYIGDSSTGYVVTAPYTIGGDTNFDGGSSTSTALGRF